MRVFCPGDKMSFFRRLVLTAIPVYLLCSLASAQTANEVQDARQVAVTNPLAPKVFSCPSPSVAGDVPVRIVIDAEGNVSEANALKGPESLITAAEACAKTWKYERPASAPVTTTVVLRYQSQDCPAAKSQQGQLQYSWGLRNSSNLELAYIDGEQPPPPPYPDDIRTAGIAGRMALSVSLNADGTVKEVHVVQSLSPELDKAVMDQLRPLKFKLLDGVSAVQLQGLIFQIVFHATCTVPKIIDYVEQ
jgi:TonB family protein